MITEVTFSVAPGGTQGSKRAAAARSVFAVTAGRLRRGLVRREPDPGDRRAVQVLLTAEGHELAEDFFAATCRRVDELAASLSTQDRDRLAALLGTIVRENEAPTVFLDAYQP